MLHEHFFTDRSSMMRAVQTALCAHLQQDLLQHPQISLFVSGGSTPVPLYQALAEEQLPWQRVNVALVDERFVPVTDAASNEKLVRENLLRKHAAAAGFTGMSVASFSAQPELSTVVQTCNANYAQVPHPYSAAILGMGPDGHTASLFPHANGLEEALVKHQHCMGIQASPSATTSGITQRISMTRWALLQCKSLYLLFTGTEKKAIYEQAKTAPDHYGLPIAVFLQQQEVPVEVYWCP
jgi:6-phosphogluconolactonase